MKKKIFFILSTNEYSGAEAVSINIINELKEKYDFYYVSKKGLINNYLKENNIKWIEINEISAKEINRVIKEYKPNLIHAVNYRISTLCALTNTNVPIISHLHNNALWIKRFNRNSIGFLYAGLRAKKILTVSDSIEREYVFSKLLRKKIINVSNPVSRKSVLSKIDKKNFEKKYDICCVARIMEPKNPKLFVDIIYELKKKYHNIKTIWIGDGDLKKDIIKYSIEKGLNNNIDFIGFKKNPFQYIFQSKVFLLTSQWEGYGLAAFEALTLGLPCVTSNVGGLPEIIDNSCGKLCDINCPEEYIKELSTLLDNKEYYELKQKSAIQKSKKIENIDKYIDRISEIYDKILE